MKALNIFFDQSGVSKKDRLDRASKCGPEIQRINADMQDGFDSQYAAVYLPFNSAMIDEIKNTVKLYELEKPDMLIIIGIGGSNLGTKAVQEAILGVFEHALPFEIYYVDTVDPDAVETICAMASRLMKVGKNVLINIVTKSGLTTETIVNGTIFIDLLKKYYGSDYTKHLVVTTDYESPLWNIAVQEKWPLLGIPKKVGGRFSVLSAVGLFPLALMNIDIDQLCAGAAVMTQQCLLTDMELNNAAQSAAVIYNLYKEGYVIHNFFPFSVYFQGLGMWYRQLMAESLGKEIDLAGAPVHVGITPTVSIGSVDLHSIVQLHLAGPYNTLTTFIGIETWQSTVRVPEYKELDDIVKNVQGKQLSAVMNAVCDGTLHAYSVKQRPFISVKFPAKTEFYLGQFLQWKIFEIIYLGYLFNIDPFTQPHVELYKKATRELLEQD